MGLAYLPDGKRMEYSEYLKTPLWRQKKMNRLAYDCWQCCVCHVPIDDPMQYQTHHINYERLGHEDVQKDIVTLCINCHERFHKHWKRNEYWSTGENPIDHWRQYSLKDTAKLCMLYEQDDYWLGGQHNLCSTDTVRGYIDRYFAENECKAGAMILETDVMLYMRNKRYDLILANAVLKKDMDIFLDEHFGSKGQKGGNKIRTEARAFYTRHPIGALKRIYKENENIIILMDEVKKMKEETNHEQA